MLQKIIKTGNSIAVTVPSQFVKSVGVKVGDDVRVTVRPDRGQVVYTFKGTHQLSLDEELKRTSALPKT